MINDQRPRQVHTFLFPHLIIWFETALIILFGGVYVKTWTFQIVGIYYFSMVGNDQRTVASDDAASQ